MSLPLVWSERVDNAPDGRLHDCTQAAALMALIYAGWGRFPLGIYTPEERNALDAADTRPDNTGATFDGRIPGAGHLDAQVFNRYGVRLHAAPVTTTAALAAALRVPGRAYILAGSLKHFEPRHHLRRWQPTFEGGHALTVIALGNDKVLWLDPLAPNKFSGDIVTPDVAAQFAWQDYETRWLAKDELAVIPANTSTSTEEDMQTVITISPLPAGSRIYFPVNVTTPLYDANALGPVNRFVGRSDRESPAECDATVTIERSPKAAPVGTFRRIKGGQWDGLLAQKDTVRLSVPDAQPHDCSAEVAEAIKHFNNNLQEWASQRPTS